MEQEPGRDDRTGADDGDQADSLDMEPFEAQFAEEFKRPPRRAPRHGGSVLMAAMIGLAEALGMDPEPTEIAQPASPANGPDLDMSFGDLPPLDEA